MIPACLFFQRSGYQSVLLHLHRLVGWPGRLVGICFFIRTKVFDSGDCFSALDQGIDPGIEPRPRLPLRIAGNSIRHPSATCGHSPPRRPLAHPEPWDKGSSRLDRLAPASAIGANAACRSGQPIDLGTRREWCPVSLAVPATPRRTGRTETLTRLAHTSDSNND